MTPGEHHDFEKKNVFGLNNLDVPIYRIFRKERLVEAIQNQSLVLVKPKSWEDPFENFLLTRRIVNQGSRVDISEFQERLFGLCWSLCHESDAMWRIYSPAGCKKCNQTGYEGVKVRTTARKLFQVLLSQPHRFAPLRYFIGAVEYLPEADLIRNFSDPDIWKSIAFDSAARGPVVGLLMKRVEFNHEQEVRLVFQCAKEERHDKLKSFPIEPNQLFEEIVLDPRITSINTVDCWRKEFEGLGFKNPIFQSKLYQLPINDIEL